jgi:hypothetical protein
MAIWEIHEYSPYARQLASKYTRAQLEAMLQESETATRRYSRQHLGSIKKTTSMQSNSARRANTRNKMSAEWERMNAVRNAIEIHDVWPEHAKGG